jgi:hypothetical protein
LLIEFQMEGVHGFRHASLPAFRVKRQRDDAQTGAMRCTAVITRLPKLRERGL